MIKNGWTNEDEESFEGCNIDKRNYQKNVAQLKKFRFTDWLVIRLIWNIFSYLDWRKMIFFQQNNQLSHSWICFKLGDSPACWQNMFHAVPAQCIHCSLELIFRICSQMHIFSTYAACPYFTRSKKKNEIGHTNEVDISSTIINQDMHFVHLTLLISSSPVIHIAAYQDGMILTRRRF